VADQEARDELRRLLDAAAGRLLDAGLSWDEVVVVIRKRLVPALPLDAAAAGLERVSWIPQEAEAVPALVEAASGPGGPLVAQPPVMEFRLPAATAEFPRARVVEVAAPADAPGEPPVGSVVTDTRSRVCWRDGEGWHRSDGHEGSAERALSWTDIVQAVGGAADPTPRPGQPTVVSSPPRRAQGPMVVRPAGRLELPVQVPVLGEDGQPLLGPNGQPMLKTETESMDISEVVPAGGRP